jgi:hypothetical protein
MSPAQCPRLFEAEAMRDDRLGSAERASFERHLSVCRECSREVQALERLAEALRDDSPQAPVEDELHVRRERLRLLAAYDWTLIEPSRGPSARRRWLAIPAVAALLVAVVLWRVHREAPQLHASNAVVHADSTAVWSRRTVGDREQVVLERGALFIRVEHRTPVRSQFLVVLPDGELEDIGTTFTVSAQDGHTTRVSVQEGSIVLRLRGLPPVAIGAGDTWVPDTAVSAQACLPNASPAAAAATAAPSASRPREPASRSVTRRSVERQPDPAGDYRAAVSVLENGKPAEAAAAFARFGAKYPWDPRAEDAAYLRVIALQKQGGVDAEVNGAAKQYLSRFPAGLRRIEVEKLCDRP